jgi:nucleoside-diphosphate-sugar epimerase
VRDVVRACWLTLEHGVPGEVYNIGSGVRRSVGEMRSLVCVTSQPQQMLDQVLRLFSIVPDYPSTRLRTGPSVGSAQRFGAARSKLECLTFRGESRNGWIA